MLNSCIIERVLLYCLAYAALADRVTLYVMNWEDLEGSCCEVTRVAIRVTVCEVLLTHGVFGRTANCSHDLHSTKSASYPLHSSHEHSTKHTADKSLNNMCI
jgi:hypothetical protein